MRFQKMAVNDPQKLISLRDSLDNQLSLTQSKAFVKAYNSVGMQALKTKNYKKAINLFLKSQELSSSDTLSKYHLLMTLGHEKVDSGKKELIWQSIQDYYKASALYPQRGEPFYFIGQSYLKLGDKDFDLIIESYEKALSLMVDQEFRDLTIKAKEDAFRRKKLLKNFWK
tara:strand:+ start:143 stop:652 length:510 start_codon:yes stop_codon:yes gene_type:complete